jgi:glutathione S-transferase
VPQPILWSWHLSPFAGKVRIALAEKGAEVDLVEIDPRERPPRLRELNPTNTVPVLEAGDVVIRESGAICDWVQDACPGPSLWPADPATRARARGLARYVDDELTTNFFFSFRKQAFGPSKGDPPDIVDVLRGRLMRRWPAVDELLGRTDGSWLAGGPEPSLADLGAIPLAVRLVEWGPQLEPPAELTRVTGWLDALRGRPSAAEVNRRGRPAPAAGD